jgi:hypothetical protein
MDNLGKKSDKPMPRHAFFVFAINLAALGRALKPSTS